jgi:hypothetical protein
MKEKVAQDCHPYFLRRQFALKADTEFAGNDLPARRVLIRASQLRKKAPGENQGQVRFT